MATEAERDALRAMLVEGVLEASFDGRTVKYQSATEIRATLRQVEAELAAASAGTNSRTVRVTVVKD